MVRRNARFEVGQIEQLPLIGLMSTHHDPPRRPTQGRRNHDSPIRTRDFFNGIDQKRKDSTEAYRVRFTRWNRRRVAGDTEAVVR
jgi:hypothetical protein